MGSKTRPRGSIRAAFFFLLLASTDTWSGERVGQGPYASFVFFGHTEPLPLKSYAGKFDGDLDRGSDGALFYTAELGWQIDGWTVALTRRYHYAIDASRDLVELRSLEKNGLPLPTGRPFDVDLEIVGFEGSGISVSHDLDVGRFRLTPRLSLVDGSALIHGTLEGALTPTSGDTFDASFELDYFYSEEEKFFGRKVDRPSGVGLLFDLDGEWLISDGWFMRFSIDDLASYVFWESAPFTEAVGSTANSNVGSGISNSVPLVSGLESFDDFTQHLRPHGQAEIAHTYGGDEYALGTYIGPTGLLPFLQYETSMGDAKGTFRWVPEVNAFGVGLVWGDLQASCLADSTSIGRAKLVDFSVRYTKFFD